MQEYPLWYKLLFVWTNVDRRTGLSFPFLIGAINKESYTTATPDDIGDLLSEMANSAYDKAIIVRHCPNLNEPVFGLTDPNIKFSFGVWLTKKLYIAESIEFTGQDITDFTEQMKDGYTEIIENKTFSKSLYPPQVWTAFTNEDEKFINKAINYVIAKTQ